MMARPASGIVCKPRSRSASISVVLPAPGPPVMMKKRSPPRALTGYLLSADAGFLRNSGFLASLEEWHHRAQFGAHFFDRLILSGFAHGEKLLSPIAIFLQPRARESARLTLAQNLPPFSARLLADDTRPAGVVAVFGGVGDRIAHIAKAAFVDQVHDQLQFMQTLEVRNLGCIAGVRERLKTGANQLAHTAAQHRLFSKKIALGLFLEGGFNNARLQTAESLRIRQRIFERVAGGILRNRNQCRNAYAFGEELAHAMSRRLRRNHRDINIRRWLDFVEVDIEAVREHQRLALLHVGRDVVAISVALHVIGYKDHDNVGFFRRVGD